MQRCTPEAERGVRVREPVEHDLVGVRGTTPGSWLHIAYDRNMRSPAENGNPATSQSCVIVRPPPCAGREVPQELLGRGVHVVGVVDQADALVGARVEPLERAGEQRRRGVEATTDEQRDGADDALVGEELAHHLGVEQRGDHARTRFGLADLHVFGEPSDHAHGRLDHAVPVGAVRVPCTPACARARSRSPSRRGADRASPS